MLRDEIIEVLPPHLPVTSFSAKLAIHKGFYGSENLFLKPTPEGGIAIYQKVEVEEPIYEYNGKTGRVTQTLFGVGLFECDGNQQLVDMRQVEVV